MGRKPKNEGDITPKELDQRRINEENKTAKDALKVVKTWYEEKAGKIVKKVKKNNGAVYSFFMFKVKGNESLVKQYREEKKLA
jgi:hypothetical protein